MSDMKWFTILFLSCLIVLKNFNAGEAAGMNYKMMHLGDVSLAYNIIDQSDSGKNILLIMGYGCTMDMWPTQMINSLKKHARLIIFDNRGMGYSSGGNKDFSIELFAEDTNALLDSLGIENVSIVGWSMGTAVALQTALTKPDRVKSMVLISGFCGGKKSIWPPDPVWNRVLDLSGTLAERIQRMMNNLFPEKFLLEHPGLTGVFPEISEPVNDEMIFRQGKTIKKWNGCYSRLAGIKAPVVLISGNKDIVIPMQNSSIIASQINKSYVHIIEDGGHGVLYQNPDSINAQIISLISGQE